MFGSGSVNGDLCCCFFVCFYCIFTPFLPVPHITEFCQGLLVAEL